MKDLTNPHLFDDEKIEMDRTLKRVIRTEAWNDKLDEIQEWKDEQERAKHRNTEDDLQGAASYTDYNQVNNIRTSDEQLQFLKETNNTDYENKVEKIRMRLKIPGAKQVQSPGAFMGPSNPNARMKKGPNLTEWLEVGTMGKELSILEEENNRRLLDNGNSNQNTKRPIFSSMQKTKIVEKKPVQDFRLMKEDRLPLLFVYQLSAIMFVFSPILILLKASILIMFPSWSLLAPALIGLVYTTRRLSAYKDGPIFGNYFGKTDLYEQDKEAFEQQLAEQEAAEQEAEQAKANRQSLRNFGGPHPAMGGGELSLDDEDENDYDDYEEDEQEQEAPQPVRRIRKPGHDSEEMAIPDPVIFTNVKTDEDKQKMFLAEESFLEDLFKRRGDLGELHTPTQILNVFGPLLADYNDDFASVKKLSRKSAEFKNISYLIGKTYSQIYPKFKNANKHEEEYYYVIDDVYETGLFYKAKIRMPSGLQKKILESSGSEMLKDNLKEEVDDSTDVSIEVPNDSGSIKIYKIKTIGDDSFTPIISTGDIFRFDGIKTTGGRPIMDELEKPNDFNMIFGLSNSENVLAYDIAGKQNVGIAIAGDTGSGKSASSGSWLVNALVTHSPDEVGFLIFDVKDGTFWANFKYSPHVLGYFGSKDLDKFTTIMQILNDVHLARQDHLTKDVHGKNYAETRKLFKAHGDWDRIITVPRLIVILDEQFATLTSLGALDEQRKAENSQKDKADKLPATNRDQYLGGLARLAVVVRESGITFISISQRTTVDAFPKALLANSTIKFGMKLNTPADAERILGKDTTHDLTKLPTGSGYMISNGMHETQVTTPLFSGNPDFLEELTRIIALAWVIIQDARVDLYREPQGFYLTDSSQKNIDKMDTSKIDHFNLYNRNEIFQEANDLLKEGTYIHFDIYAKADPDFSIDLSSDGLSKHFNKVKKQKIEKPTEDKDNQKQVHPSGDGDKAIGIIRNRENHDNANQNADEQKQGGSLQDALNILLAKKKEYKLPDKELDKMTYDDVNEFFRVNQISKINIVELKDYFNLNTIEVTINKGILSFDNDSGDLTYMRRF